MADVTADEARAADTLAMAQAILSDNDGDPAWVLSLAATVVAQAATIAALTRERAAIVAFVADIARGVDPDVSVAARIGPDAFDGLAGLRADLAAQAEELAATEAAAPCPTCDGRRVVATGARGVGAVVQAAPCWTCERWAELRADLTACERLRARLVDAEAEASRWGDAIVAIGEAVGVHGGSTAEVVAAVQRAVAP